VIGCRENLISLPSRRKFATLFGVDLDGWDRHETPRTSINVFKGQAFWSERGITFGVAACTNHIEGTHGRLNERVRKLGNLNKRFAAITSAVIRSAARWSRKVQRGWHATNRKLQGSAREHELSFQNCAEPVCCDKGLLLSRRLGRQVPCPHTILPRGWSKDDPPAQFSLSTTDVPDISFTEFEGEWTPEVPREKTKVAAIEDGIEAALLGRTPPQRSEPFIASGMSSRS
jgi:hypothetical protein